MSTLNFIPSKNALHPPFAHVEEAFMLDGNIQNPQSPVVMSAVHAGRQFPDQENLQTRTGVSLHEIDQRGDTFTDGLAFDAARKHKAILIAANAAPGIINLGRATDSIAPNDIEGPINDIEGPMGSLKSNPNDIYTPRGQGLIMSKSFASGEPVFLPGQGRTAEEVEALIQKFHRAFHDQHEQIVKTVMAAHKYAFIFDVHSYPGSALEGEPDPTGTKRPDVLFSNLGGGPRASCDDAIMWRCSDIASKYGYSVGENDPYQGGYITKKFATYSDFQTNGERESLQVELSRQAYGLDFDTLEITCKEDFMRMQAFMEEVVEEVTKYAHRRAEFYQTYSASPA